MNFVKMLPLLKPTFLNQDCTLWNGVRFCKIHSELDLRGGEKHKAVSRTQRCRRLSSSCQPQKIPLYKCTNIQFHTLVRSKQKTKSFPEILLYVLGEQLTPNIQILFSPCESEKISVYNFANIQFQTLTSCNHKKVSFVSGNPFHSPVQALLKLPPIFKPRLLIKNTKSDGRQQKLLPQFVISFICEFTNNLYFRIIELCQTRNEKLMIKHWVVL